MNRRIIKVIAIVTTVFSFNFSLAQTSTREEIQNEIALINELGKSAYSNSSNPSVVQLKISQLNESIKKLEQEVSVQRRTIANKEGWSALEKELKKIKEGWLELSNARNEDFVKMYSKNISDAAKEFESLYQELSLEKK